MKESKLEIVEIAVEEAGLPALPEVLNALKALSSSWGLPWSAVFEAVHHARDAVENLEREAVRLARFDGESWDAIGTHLGISGAGARKRHMTGDRAGLDELDALDALHEAESRALASEWQRDVMRARNELRGLYDSEEALTSAAMKQASNQDYSDRFLALLDKHVKERAERVKQLESKRAPRRG